MLLLFGPFQSSCCLFGRRGSICGKNIARIQKRKKNWCWLPWLVDVGPFLHSHPRLLHHYDEEDKKQNGSSPMGPSKNIRKQWTIPTLLPSIFQQFLPLWYSSHSAELFPTQPKKPLLQQLLKATGFFELESNISFTKHRSGQPSMICMVWKPKSSVMLVHPLPTSSEDKKNLLQSSFNLMIPVWLSCEWCFFKIMSWIGIVFVWSLIDHVLRRFC